MTKGSYTISGAIEEGIIVESGGEFSSSGSFNTQGVSGGQASISSKQEAVQLYPQEIHLKLRISKEISFKYYICLIFFFSWL